MSGSRLGALAIAALLLTSVAPAAAQLSDEDRARIHFRTGTSYYDQGRYLEAASQFRESYALSGRTHLLLNVSRCFELAGSFPEAATALEEYLAAEPEAEDRRTLEQRLEQLRARAGSDAAPDGSADPPPDTGEGTGGGGADVTVPVILLGIGGAIALGSIGTGVAALDLQGSLESECGADRVCDPSLRSDRDTGEALAITTDVLLGVGAATAAVGVVLLVLALTEGDGDDEAPTPTAGCGPDGCVAGVRGAF